MKLLGSQGLASSQEIANGLPQASTYLTYSTNCCIKQWEIPEVLRAWERKVEWEKKKKRNPPLLQFFSVVTLGKETQTWLKVNHNSCPAYYYSIIIQVTNSK